MINNQLIEISCKFLLTNDLYMINSSHGRVIRKKKEIENNEKEK